MAEAAISAGVTGTAGFLRGVSADPVTAQDIITLRCTACLLTFLGPSEPAYRAARQPDTALCMAAARSLPPIVRCAKPPAIRSWNESELESGAISPGPAAPWLGDGVPGLRTRGSLMSSLLQDYLPLVVFIAVAIGIGLALLIAPFIIAYQNPDPEKLSAYECGFNAFDDARMKLDVRFYLVAILFIIFDLEVSFLFPWAVAFGQLGAFGFWSMMIFLGVLTVGFIYEWKKGALEWD
jgi:NADH-quinone oxidoreductase subunit A